MFHVRSDGVGMFVAEKWVDSVLEVERHSDRVLILKMVLDNSLMNVLMGKPEEEKEFFERIVSLVELYTSE